MDYEVRLERDLRSMTSGKITFQRIFYQKRKDYFLSCSRSFYQLALNSLICREIHLSSMREIYNRILHRDGVVNLESFYFHAYGQGPLSWQNPLSIMQRVFDFICGCVACCIDPTSWTSLACGTRSSWLIAFFGFSPWSPVRTSLYGKKRFSFHKML